MPWRGGRDRGDETGTQLFAISAEQFISECPYYTPTTFALMVK
jgi:hypothetical protein